MEQTKNAKLVIGIVLGVIVLAALYYFFIKAPRAHAPTSDMLQATTTLPSGEARSDEALDADLKALDAQVEALGSADAEVDKALEEGALIPN